MKGNKSKEIRELIDYTAAKQAVDSNSWYAIAISFHDAAKLLYRFPDCNIRVSTFNAALSIELILKSIIVKKASTAPNATHDLLNLSEAAEVSFDHNQKKTLEFFKEIIFWVGRYPNPSENGIPSERLWDKFYDDVLPKHKIQTRRGKVSTTLRNDKTFPSLENYMSIWHACIAKYDSF